MLDFSSREQIEVQLLAEVRESRRRYEAGECGLDKFAEALKRFSDPVLRSSPLDITRGIGEDYGTAERAMRQKISGAQI
jgi:hypothetical protein